MKIKVSALIDVGKVRDNNEDALVCCSDLSQQNWNDGNHNSAAYELLGNLGALLVVADGMGGVNAGEVASSLAVNTVKEHFSIHPVQEALASGNDGIVAFLKDAIAKAADVINQRMATDPETEGMGTTIVICWILQDGQAHIAWCGDSRAYLYNQTEGLRRLTKDHSLVQELVDSGEITEEEAFYHPDNNIITCGLGGYEMYPVPDIVTCDLKPNDTIMLCSDGLCGYCTDQDIKRVFDAEHINTDNCCKKMLDRALEAGGEDNIAIVMASFIDEQEKTTQAKAWWKKLFRSS